MTKLRKEFRRYFYRGEHRRLFGELSTLQERAA